MKVVSRLTAGNDEFEIDGKITVESARIKGILYMNNEVVGMDLILTLKVDCSIDGFEVDDYSVVNTHRLPDAEYQIFKEDKMLIKNIREPKSQATLDARDLANKTGSSFYNDKLIFSMKRLSKRSSRLKPLSREK